jgi:hypothetical protein
VRRVTIEPKGMRFTNNSRAEQQQTTDKQDFNNNIKIASNIKLLRYSIILVAILIPRAPGSPSQDYTIFSCIPDLT